MERVGKERARLWGRQNSTHTPLLHLRAESERQRESAEELENPHIHRDRERDRERGIKKRTQEIDRTNLTRFYPTSDI